MSVRAAEPGFENIPSRSDTGICNLGTPDFISEFFIYMNSYLNSSVMKCSIWIHDHEVLHEFGYEFMIMKKIVNHISEFIYSKLRAIEFIYIIYMNSFMNSVLWRISWIHGWISVYEFTYEIMVEFINLKLIWIQLQICFSEGTNFTHPK